MATLWNSAAGVNGYIRLTGGVKSGLITGVMSCSTADVEIYDLNNYRDLFLDTSQPEVIIGVTQTGAGMGGDGTTAQALGNFITQTTIPGVINLATPAANSFSTDDRISHTPPKPELKKKTLMTFTSGASGAGNVLAACWADEFVGFGPDFEYI